MPGRVVMKQLKVHFHRCRFARSRSCSAGGELMRYDVSRASRHRYSRFYNYITELRVFVLLGLYLKFATVCYSRRCNCRSRRLVARFCGIVILEFIKFLSFTRVAMRIFVSIFVAHKNFRGCTRPSRSRCNGLRRRRIKRENRRNAC